MATKKLYDLAVKTGEYTNGSGEKKGRWQNVGSVMQSDDGGKFIMLSRWFNPAGVPDFSGKGGESILLSMFEPKDKSGGNNDQQASKPAAQQAKTEDYGDDIPF